MATKDTLAALQAEVERNNQVDQSAIALLNGITDRIQAAVDAAVANGATAEQVAQVQAEVDAIKASTDALAAAVQANTPGA